MAKPVLVISTYPSKPAADKAVSHIVGQRLAACANIIPISSVYWWQNKLEKSKEYLVLFKTISTKKKSLKDEIAKTHPYKVPEIAQVDLLSINKSYLDWLVDSTKS